MENKSNDILPVGIYLDQKKSGEYILRAEAVSNEMVEDIQIFLKLNENFIKDENLDNLSSNMSSMDVIASAYYMAMSQILAHVVPDNQNIPTSIEYEVFEDFGYFIPMCKLAEGTGNPIHDVQD